MRGLLLSFLLLALPVQAEQIVADLSQDRISISTNFDGSEILIFGAVKRDQPEPNGEEMAIIITVTGPRENVTVRRKERKLGIWVNSDSVDVSRAPSFYAVASSVPLAQALHPDDDAQWRISTARVLTPVGELETPPETAEFLDAMIRVNTASGVYGTAEEGITLRENTLFSADIELPADVTEGLYQTRIFLTRNGRIIDRYDTSIYVQKVGMERWIYRLAHDQPFLYGLLSLFIAIAAGWTASAAFRIFNR